LPSNAADDSATNRDVVRLTRENARLVKQLMQTDAALEIMGKLGTPPRPVRL
jgi:transposase